MQLGKALVGAILGAALGVGLLIALYLSPLKLDAVWMAIPIAILTGLGVRMMVSTWGHASYARGALTGVLALAAYLGTWYLAPLAQRAFAKPDERNQKIAAVEQPAETADEGAAPGDVPETAKAPATAPRPSGVATQRAAPPRGFSPMDYLWLCIAALIAYELGRGTAAKPVVVMGDETAAPQGAPHPDA